MEELTDQDLGVLVAGGSTTLATGAGPRRERLLRDPEPRDVMFPFISVDDHLVEPPDVYRDRLPRALAERAPRVVRGDDGNDYWEYEDDRIPFSGSNVVASWDPDDWTFGPVRIDEARPGTWDVHMRVKDMDLNGVVASLNFPSMTIGFAGQRFMKMRDEELALAAMRAYNDWIIESWVEPYPQRIIPCQVTWLRDPEVAAQEIRKNAERGFKAVAFSENPEQLGLPSIHTEEWDPFFRACEESNTAINLHVGSSSKTVVPSASTPVPANSLLFPVNGFVTTVDWLYAKIPLRFPEIKVVFSEGGIGWLAMLLDRMRYQSDFFADEGLGDFWGDTSITPEEALKRNFWFTTFYDPSAYVLLDEIGAEKVMLESDYPHGDSSWPDSQKIIHSQIGAIPESVTSLLAWRNARDVYRHEFDFADVTRHMKLVRPLYSEWYSSPPA